MARENLTGVSDEELVHRYRNSYDTLYIGELYQRYTHLVFGVCMKYLKNEQEAKDCVQQIFLKVITELQKYKVEYFKSWIYMIAKNHCLMKLRGNKAIAVELDEQITPAVNDNLDKTERIEKDKLLTKMQGAIEKLNPQQQQCVNLFYLQKKSYAEITEITGLTMLQVKSHLQNGKRNLKLMMEN